MIGPDDFRPLARLGEPAGSAPNLDRLMPLGTFYPTPPVAPDPKPMRIAPGRSPVMRRG